MCIASFPSTTKWFMKCPKCGGISINKGVVNEDKFSWLVAMDGGRLPVKFKCLRCKHSFLYE